MPASRQRLAIRQLDDVDVDLGPVGALGEEPAMAAFQPEVALIVAGELARAPERACYT
jgi:hypothetical protein